jgi:hypothetical protein
MRRWPAGAGLLIVTILLTGCGAGRAQFDRFIAQKTRQVSNAVQVQTTLGPLKLYRVTSLGQCGEGYELAGGVTESTRQCGNEEALTLSGSGGGGYVLLMGSIHDPRITQVKLDLTDGRQLQAQVADGLWYLFLPGEAKIPQAKLTGLDDTGNQVYPKVK